MNQLYRYQTYKARFGYYTVDMSGVPKDDKEIASEELQTTLDMIFWRDPDLTVDLGDEIPESPSDCPHKLFEWDTEEKKWKRSDNDPSYVEETNIEDLLSNV